MNLPVAIHWNQTFKKPTTYVSSFHTTILLRTYVRWKPRHFRQKSRANEL